ncbi:Unknown protein sequence [Pseudomonas amygdali pv. sesami]|nr:Unknown protein sequence [Pseudomonas amygdali pv. sesami]
MAANRMNVTSVVLDAADRRFIQSLKLPVLKHRSPASASC